MLVEPWTLVVLVLINEVLRNLQMTGGSVLSADGLLHDFACTSLGIAVLNMIKSAHVVNIVIIGRVECTAFTLLSIGPFNEESDVIKAMVDGCEICGIESIGLPHVPLARVSSRISVLLHIFSNSFFRLWKASAGARGLEDAEEFVDHAKPSRVSTR